MTSSVAEFPRWAHVITSIDEHHTVLDISDTAFEAIFYKKDERPTSDLEKTNPDAFWENCADRVHILAMCFAEECTFCDKIDRNELTEENVVLLRGGSRVSRERTRQFLHLLQMSKEASPIRWVKGDSWFSVNLYKVERYSEKGTAPPRLSELFRRTIAMAEEKDPAGLSRLYAAISSCDPSDIEGTVRVYGLFPAFGGLGKQFFKFVNEELRAQDRETTPPCVPMSPLVDSCRPRPLRLPPTGMEFRALSIETDERYRRRISK